MRFRQGLLALATVVALGVVGAPQAQAATTYFDFEGSCRSTVGAGCAGFGLDEGDLVSGSIGIDMSSAVGGATVDVFSANGSFDFDFGNQSFDIGDFSDTIFEITISADGSVLECMSGLLGCPGSAFDFVEFDNGTAFLQPHFDFVEIFGQTPTMPNGQTLTGPPPQVEPGATAKGNWVRRSSNPIPEPSAALLFAVGAVVVQRARARRA